MEQKSQQGHEGSTKKKNVIHAIKEHPLFIEMALTVVVLLAIAGAYYWSDMQSKVYIEKAEISAPIIGIGPAVPGILDKIYVDEGDEVSNGQKLFLAGNYTATAMTRGLVVSVKNVPGQFVTQQDQVVKLIDPRALRVVGRIQEDKGLSDIRPGQRVVFTVDAFGNKQYEGTVESVAYTARQSDIVFSISDKRESREFEVKAQFDSLQYPELKNGMSARMWVYK